MNAALAIIATTHLLGGGHSAFWVCGSGATVDHESSLPVCLWLVFFCFCFCFCFVFVFCFDLI
ncbi:hypothetical protein BZA05DRAFT_404869, partial [Tricharina praecox]|uniref:uncharacterized protein n=1 Tax=Tricharina praecox TaxID=43433 RepID=UPI00221FE8D7